MGCSIPNKIKPHAVCVPFPAQGHITPMLKLAKLLHSNYGFHIIFVNTHYNHHRLLNSGALSPHLHVPHFHFESIPDSLPVPPKGFEDATQDVNELCRAIMEKRLLEPFKEVLQRINSADGSPPVSCIIVDGVMSFTLDAAEEMGLPEVIFWTTSACGFMGYIQYGELIDRGITPFKDESQFKDEYLDVTIDWIPGMRDIRVRDSPSFIRTTDPDDVIPPWTFGPFFIISEFLGSF